MTGCGIERGMAPVADTAGFLLCYPDDSGTSMALECLKYYKGSTIIHGEEQDEEEVE